MSGEGGEDEPPRRLLDGKRGRAVGDAVEELEDSHACFQPARETVSAGATSTR